MRRGSTTLAPLPLVDVFICTYNEEEAILERTIVGALSMDYPRYRVWVLDDGRRPWLAELCERLGCRLSHAPRQCPRQGRQHQQRRCGMSPGLAEPPDFISILDADFVPMPKFLRRALSLFRERRRRHRADAAALHQSRPDAEQSVGGAGLAGRAALFLRRRDGVEGRLGRLVLLRHVVGHSLRRAAGRSAAFPPIR